jgi:hypothetical protein
MTKSGRGVLLIITNAAPEFEAEFNEWYDREHLKDRVGTPGFLSARRYTASEGRWKYLAVYETDAIAVFDSAVYKQKLANQTDWSKRILKQFRSPHRAIARIGASQGFGVGGVTSIAKLVGAASDRTDGLRKKVAETVIPLTEASDEASLVCADPGRTAAALDIQLQMLGVFRLMMEVSRPDLN